MRMLQHYFASKLRHFFVELCSKTALQDSYKQLKYTGT